MGEGGARGDVRRVAAGPGRRVSPGRGDEGGRREGRGGEEDGDRQDGEDGGKQVGDHHIKELLGLQAVRLTLNLQTSSLGGRKKLKREDGLKDK